MTANPEDSLKFPETYRLLKRICRSLGFDLHNMYASFSPVEKIWVLNAGEDSAIFLAGHDGYGFKTARDLLKGILDTKTFKVRSINTFEEKTVQNPFYSLDLAALEVKLDLINPS